MNLFVCRKMNRKIYIFCILVLHTLMNNAQPLQNGKRTRNELVDKCSDCFRKLQRKETMENKKFVTKETKKDLFVSRGWGAGGMPFSVLYMNPLYSSKAPATVETSYKASPLTASREGPKSLPQVRTSIMKNKFRNSLPRSVIPQLFVSYGWGPLGQK